MTWRELLEELKKMTPAQLEGVALYQDTNTGEDCLVNGIVPAGDYGASADQFFLDIEQ